MQPPVAAEAGLGGTYFFMDSEGRRVAIIKPVDEEPLAPNNPKARCAGRSAGLWAWPGPETCHRCLLLMLPHGRTAQAFVW